MSYPRHALLVLPYLRLELPGWGRVYRAVGGEREASWSGAPARELRGKLHGYWMRVELSNWSERKSWFLGRFYDLETQLFVLAALREGETFVDAGANIGMLTLLAASCVGASGVVHAIEPNPSAMARLSAAVERNHLGCVRLHRVGLSDRDEELVLRVVTQHTGLGTFADVPAEERAAITAEHRVHVLRGDDLLAGKLLAPAVLKIDVEGFECRVLRGFEKTLLEHRPAVVIEAIGSQLARAGASLEELFSILHGHGYRAFALRTRRAGLARRLVLDEIGAPSGDVTDNLAFLHAGGSHLERLRADARVHVKLI